MAQLSVRELRKDSGETDKKYENTLFLNPVATLKSQRL